MAIPTVLFVNPGCGARPEKTQDDSLILFWGPILTQVLY